jgi:hypothetical protein
MKYTYQQFNLIIDLFIPLVFPCSKEQKPGSTIITAGRRKKG